MYNMYVYWTYLPTSLPTIYVNYICSLPPLIAWRPSFWASRFMTSDKNRGISNYVVTVMVIGNGDDYKDDGDDDDT